MTKPRIPWKEIWQRFDAYCERYDPGWSQQKPYLKKLVMCYVGSWTVDWKTMWDECEKYIAEHTERDWWDVQQPLIQRLVRKHLQAPKEMTR